MNETQQAIALVSDYKVVFGSPTGKRVLHDLERKFLHQVTTDHVSCANTVAVAHINGQRDLILYIKRQVEWELKELIAKLDAAHSPIEEDVYANTGPDAIG